ncbi:hypothetical protein ACTFIR_011886 [Dictyostelium discoideum]
MKISSSSTSASNSAESLDLRIKSMENQINNLFLAFTRFMKDSMPKFQPIINYPITNLVSLLVEEECILKKDEIFESNKVFNFPSNFQVNVAPFGTPEGIHVSSTIENNDTDLLIVEKRINDILKPLLIISSMLSSDSHNIDVELISYFAQSTIVLAINAQASLSRVRRNNIIKVPLSRK